MNKDNIQKENPLGVEDIGKLISKFSIPAIIGMLVNALYNIVDRMFIGNASNLGANGLAGITIGFPIMIVLLSVGVLFGIGGATLYSISLGREKHEYANKVLCNAFMLLFIIGSVILVLGQIFLVDILKAFGASDTVLPYSIEYMRIIFFGSIFSVVSIGLNHFLRADGQPKLAMITMFVGAGTNIILDPIFIYIFNMGMTGAATATIISQFISFSWLILYFFGKKNPRRIKIENLRFDKGIISEIISLGMPNFVLQFVSSFLMIILNKTLLKYGGDIAISAMGITSSIQTLIFMPVIGLNQGVQPIISFNYGAKKYARIREAEKIAIKVATIIIVIGWLIGMIFARQLVQLFNQEANLVNLGSLALRSWILCMPVIGFQIIGSNFFQAINRPKVALLLTLTRQLFALIPAILIFGKIWGLNGVLLASPFADFLTFLITLFFYVRAYNNLENM